MAEIFILLGLIILNGLLVMSEIALVSARRVRLEQLANKGNANAKAALALSENPEVFLSTAQIGITLIAIITGLYSGEKFGKDLKPFVEKFAVLHDYADRISTILVVAIVTFVSIILGELVPKRIGLLKAEKIAMAAATPMRIFASVTFPIVWLLNLITRAIFKLFKIEAGKDNAVTEDEIKAMINEGAESGEIEEAEQEIIERVFHLGDRAITSLMTHRSDIVWIDINADMGGLLEKAQPHAHSVYPLCEGLIDNIKGIIQLKDVILANRDTPVRSFLKSALFVPENMTAYKLLEKFKESKVHSAFIVDEYGTLQGLITLNDILKAIVGGVSQEDEDEYEIVERADGTYLIDAQFSFYNFLARFDKDEWIDEEEQEFDTLGGFVIDQLQRIPNAGDNFEWRGFTFEIMDMDGARIDKLLVTLSEDLKVEMEENDQ
jgi:putative hemolysin